MTAVIKPRAGSLICCAQCTVLGPWFTQGVEITVIIAAIYGVTVTILRFYILPFIESLQQAYEVDTLRLVLQMVDPNSASRNFPNIS